MSETADSPLLGYLIAVLSSVLAGGFGDADLARRAAVEAMEAYRPQGTCELIAAGRILSFAMAGLDALRLSGPADLSLSMKVKLRGRATGLDRAARYNSRILDGLRRGVAVTEQAGSVGRCSELADSPTSEGVDGVPSPATTGAKSVAPVVQNWAGAMKAVAARLRGDTPSVGPVQQTMNALWIDALSGVAGEIERGGSGKAGLLGSTRLAGFGGVVKLGDRVLGGDKLAI